jgi:WD40 repeat protein
MDEETVASACSDHFIRVFSLSSPDLNSPIFTLHQPTSGPNRICALSKNTLLTSGHDRGVRIWDMRQQLPVLYFENIHYDTITSLDKLSSNIFATASDDSNLNVKLIT